MKIIGYYEKQKGNHQKNILDSFLNKFKNNGFNVVYTRGKDIFLDCNLCVFPSYNRRFREVLVKYKKIGINSVTIITPPIRDFFGSGRKYRGIFLNEPYQNIVLQNNLPSDRWDELKNRLRINLLPWRKLGNNIIIAYQYGKDFEGRSREKFFSTAIKDSLNTGREVVICTRDSLDWVNIEKWRRLGCKVKIGIRNNLTNAYCLITAGGTSDSHAIFNGVPAYTKEVRISTPLMKQRDLTQFLKNPPTPNRTKWFNWISYQQWTEREMFLGFPHKYFRDNYESCRIL